MNDSKKLLAQRMVLAMGFFICFVAAVLPATASERFVENGDGTITDIATGLM